MSNVKLPALVGDSPLAILAAIGTLRLINERVEGGARLSWDSQDWVPVLDSPLASVEEVVQELADVVDGMPDGVLVPGGPRTFPLRRPPRQRKNTGTDDEINKKRNDPMRVPLGELGRLLQECTKSASAKEVETVQSWIASLLTDLAESKGKGGVAISQFTAPAAQQLIETMLDKPLKSVRQEPDLPRSGRRAGARRSPRNDVTLPREKSPREKLEDRLRQALVSWRRVPGVTGEGLDHRAYWNSADDPLGQDGKMRGVPAATWLALMSFQLWLTTVAGSSPRTSGWHTEPLGRARVQELRLPLWREPLGPDAIRVLVEHPLLDGPWDATNHDDLKLMGVFHVCRARRWRPHDGKSGGFLAVVS